MRVKEKITSHASASQHQRPLAVVVCNLWSRARKETGVLFRLGGSGVKLVLTLSATLLVLGGLCS